MAQRPTPSSNCHFKDSPELQAARTRAEEYRCKSCATWTHVCYLYKGPWVQNPGSPPVNIRFNPTTKIVHLPQNGTIGFEPWPNQTLVLTASSRSAVLLCVKKIAPFRATASCQDWRDCCKSPLSLEPHIRVSTAWRADQPGTRARHAGCAWFPRMFYSLPQWIGQE